MISAIILTKNEVDNIRDCIESLLWVDEIIIVDDYSSDETAAEAKRQGAVVYYHGLDGDFSEQRNWALEKAKGDWVLFVDADERVTDSLAKEIQRTIAGESTNDGYMIQRRDTLWGKELHHGEVGDISLLRLAKRNAGEWKGMVHEIWKVRGTVGQLKGSIKHYPHPTVHDFLQEINIYSTLRAKELHSHHIRSSWFAVLAYPKGKFFKNYILKRGFLDGIPGLIHAVMMSFHSFLVRGKLWQLYDPEKHA